MKLVNATPVENVEPNSLSQEVQTGQYLAVVSQCHKNSRLADVNLNLRNL